MRLLFVGLNHAPELVGIGRCTGETAAWLAARGHEVTVVTGHPYYPAWRAQGPAWRWALESREGVRVIRCPLWVPRRPTAARRIAHLLSFAASSAPTAIWAARRHRPQVVIAIEPTALAAPGALAAARAAGARTWLHVQDLELGAATRLGLAGTGASGRLAAAAYRRLLQGFDRVSTLSRTMADALLDHGVPAERLSIIRNGVDVARLGAGDGAVLRRELGIAPERIVALYAGNLGEKQGVLSLVDLARMLADDRRILVVVAGDGALRPALATAAQGLANLRLLPFQAEERLAEVLALADVHLLPQKRGVSSFAMPSKLGGMLASRRACVVQTDPDSDLRHELRGAVELVDAEDTAAMAGSLRRLAGSPHRRRQLGAAAGRQAARLFDRDTELGRLEAELQTLGAGFRSPCARRLANGGELTNRWVVE